MRALAVLAIVAAIVGSAVRANAEQQAKAARGKAQDMMPSGSAAQMRHWYFFGIGEPVLAPCRTDHFLCSAVSTSASAELSEIKKRRRSSAVNGSIWRYAASPLISDGEY